VVGSITRLSFFSPLLYEEETIPRFALFLEKFSVNLSGGGALQLQFIGPVPIRVVLG
jgi:hypothetical protein